MPHTNAAGKVLATELFRRTGMSVSVGVVGVGIMLFPHGAVSPWRGYLPWVLAMLAVFAVRILLAHHALKALENGKRESAFVNIEALLCALTGLGWGSVVHVFDSQVMDQNFYLRLMILAAAMSFVVSTMTAFIRIFLAYVLSMGLVATTFILFTPYIEPHIPLAICAVVYIAMLSGVAVSNNRRLREAAVARLEVSSLTEELSRAQAVGNVGSWMYDIAADLIRLSAESCRIFGLPEGTTTHRKSYMACTHPQDRDAVNQAWQDGLQGGTFSLEHRIVLGDKVRWVRQKAEFEYSLNGTALSALGIVQDITRRKHAEEQVLQMAFSDTLTKLPNRRLTLDRLGQAMAAGERAGCHGALMFLDLDNFKPLNDTLGHVFGDLLLIEAAIRLVGCVRKIDTVGRFGGDEFVVLLSELDTDRSVSTDQAGVVAEKIRAALSVPYVLKIHHKDGADTTVEHPCTVSIGVALFLGREAAADDIVKWADAAMYQAKQAGRDSIRFYQPDEVVAA